MVRKRVRGRLGRTMMAVAVVGLLTSAVVASAAQAAPQWKVNGKLLKPAAARVFLSKSGVLVFGNGMSSPQIACKSSSAEGFLLGTEPGNPGETGFEYLTLEGCGLRFREKECPVKQEGQKPGIIKSNYLEGKLRMEGTLPRILYQSESGPFPHDPFFPSFYVEHEAECGFWGAPKPITGQLEALIKPEIGIESLSETEEFPSSPLAGTSLQWGNNYNYIPFKGVMTTTLTEPLTEKFGVFEG